MFVGSLQEKKKTFRGREESRSLADPRVGVLRKSANGEKKSMRGEVQGERKNHSRLEAGKKQRLLNIPKRKRESDPRQGWRLAGKTPFSIAAGHSP